MKYTVLWNPGAEQDLAAVWLAATDRKAVDAAATEIGLLLATRAETCGYLRPDTLRTLAVPPLAANVEVLQKSGLFTPLPSGNFMSKAMALFDSNGLSARIQIRLLECRQAMW